LASQSGTGFRPWIPIAAGLGLWCVGGLGGLAAAALSQPVRAWPSLCGGGGRRKLLPE
jgi:type IV secretory pathway TrbD component